MTIWILQNGNDFQVKADLRRICPDPGLTFSTIPGTYTAIKVNYAQSISSIGANLIGTLSKTPVGIGIRGLNSSFPIPEVGAPNQVLNERAGYTLFDKYPGTTFVDIVYDVENGSGCNGRGYWTEGTADSASAPIDFPTDVCLFHELTHAKHLITLGFSAGLASAEADAIQEENLYRSERSLPQRTGYSGGCNASPPQKPNPKVSGGKPRETRQPGGGGCFIATAALEEEHNEKLDFLRGFRDGPLSETRRGSDYFQSLYAYYYQVSPAIANLMRTNDELRHLILTAFVLPLVNYLKLSLAYPQQDIPDNLPPEWESFLVSLRDELESWALLAMPPLTEFPTDFSAEDIREDVEFVLQHVLRSSHSREAYISRLQMNNI